MSVFKILFFTLTLLLPLIFARKYGFDSMEKISVAQFDCLAKEGYSFFIARIWRSFGETDYDGLQNIINAEAAGFEEIHGYFYPCVKIKCESAAIQMQEAFEAMEYNNLEVEKLWLDIQIEHGNWSDDKIHNQNFIKELIENAEDFNDNVGIYANRRSWDKIVGLDWNYARGKELWYPHFDRKPEELQTVFKSYGNYGGWRKPKMHQFDDNKIVCGVKINRSWDCET